MIRLSAENTEHIRALRLRPSELFTVFSGEGLDYLCRLGQRGDVSVAEIIETRPSLGEPTIDACVYIALAKGDRLDYAVQKSVELGAGEVVIYPSDRSVATPGDMIKKIARLQRISLETAKQSGRGRIPEVAAAHTFVDAIDRAAKAGLPLFLYECEEKQSMKNALEQHPDARTVSIVSGPEGGFEAHEAESARAAGMLTVTLGPRILRCETAPAAALAAIMYHTGNM